MSDKTEVEKVKRVGQGIWLSIVVLVILSLYLSGCSNGSGNNSKPSSDCDKNNGRTFAVSDIKPDDVGNGDGKGNQGESGPKPEIFIAGKYVNQAFSVYVYVSNNGERAKDNAARNVRVFLRNAETDENLKEFGPFNIDEGQYYQLPNVTYDKPARVYFYVQGEIHIGNSNTDENLLSEPNDKKNLDEKDEDEETKHWRTTCGKSNEFDILSISRTLKIEGYKDADLKEPLNASNPDTQAPTLKAGNKFYLKLIALKADGGIDTNFSFSNLSSGWKLVAENASTGTVDPNDFKLMQDLPESVGPGIGRIQAQFDDVGIIKLRMKGIEGVVTESAPIGRFIPDHFVFNPEASSPIFKVRGDIGAAYDSLPDEERLWGYIGEPMELKVSLRAVSADGRTTENYAGDFDEFQSVLGSVSNPGWGLKLSSDTGDISGRLNLSPLGGFSEGEAFLSASIKVSKGSSSEETLRGLSLSVQPSDLDGVALDTAVQAMIQGKSGLLPGPFSLYGGRIHVIGGYYTQQNVTVPVVLERWDNGQFIKNDWDSESSIAQGGLSGQPDVLSISNEQIQFHDGTKNIAVTNNGGSNITCTLVPAFSGSVPSYFDFYSENLVWGQILKPEAPTGGSIIWEKEEP